MMELLPTACRHGHVDLEAATLLPDRIMLVLRPRRIEIDLRTMLGNLKNDFCVRMNEVMRPDDRFYLHCFRIREKDGSLGYRFWSDGMTQYAYADSSAERQRRIQYCHQEPVRLGLTKKPEQWPWRIGPNGN